MNIVSFVTVMIFGGLVRPHLAGFDSELRSACERFPLGHMTPSVA